MFAQLAALCALGVPTHVPQHHTVDVVSFKLVTPHSRFLHLAMCPNLSNGGEQGSCLRRCTALGLQVSSQLLAACSCCAVHFGHSIHYMTKGMSQQEVANMFAHGHVCFRAFHPLTGKLRSCYPCCFMCGSGWVGGWVGRSVSLIGLSRPLQGDF